MPDSRTVVYDFSSTKGITVKGVSGRKAYLKFGDKNQVSEIVYPTGGSIKYLYKNNAILYSANKTAHYFPGIKEVVQNPGSGEKIRTQYNYEAKSEHSFTGAGLPDVDYASDKDALLQSNNNTYRYDTSVTSIRSADCGGDIESVQTFNFLHLPLSSRITSIPPTPSNGSPVLLVETETRYMGEQGKQRIKTG